MEHQPLSDESKREIVRQICADCDRAWADGYDCGRPAVVTINQPGLAPETLNVLTIMPQVSNG